MSVSSQVWDEWQQHLSLLGDVRWGFHPDIIVQPLTPNCIKVEVRVPWAALAREADGILNRSYRNMSIRGFRPGHGPPSLLIPYIRRWLLMESLKELLLPIWSRQAAALPGQLVETSELQLDVSREDEEPCLVVSCECEVIPQVELPPLSSTPRQVMLSAPNPLAEIKVLETERSSVADDLTSTRINDGDFRTADSAIGAHLEDFESLCRTTNATTTPSLVELLTAALMRATQEQLNPESVRAVVQNKLHEAQVARAVQDQYDVKGELIQLENEVARRAARLGISTATFRATYLADEEQRELFKAQILQNRALSRLRHVKSQQDSA